MESNKQPQLLTREVVDLAIRLLVLGALGYWCFELMRPFIAVIVWGAILSIALRPVYIWLERRLGGRSTPAAILIVVLGLAVIIGPVSVLGTSFAGSVAQLTAAAEQGRLDLPSPPASVAEWPLIGEYLYTLWDEASKNLETTLQRFMPQFKAVGGVLLSLAATVGVGVLQFIASTILAGIFLTQTASIDRGMKGLAERLSPTRGVGFVDMAASTVRNVARGVVGVSILQGLLAGIGFLLAGIPFAGLWTVICVFLAIIQIGPGLVIAGALIYAWTSLDTVTALLFTIWMVPVSVVDNILKPIVMSRGLPVPMLVILIGVIGGTLAHGIVGLFIGPVVLSLGYELMRMWLSGTVAPVDDEASSPAKPA